MKHQTSSSAICTAANGATKILNRMDNCEELDGKIESCDKKTKKLGRQWDVDNLKIVVNLLQVRDEQNEVLHKRAQVSIIKVITTDKRKMWHICSHKRMKGTINGCTKIGTMQTAGEN